MKIELHGIAPPRTVSRLANRVRLLPEQWSVTGRWWPLLRDRHQLGLDENPQFDHSFEVIMASEAFADRYSALLRSPSKTEESRLLSPRDHMACKQLLEKLCWLASGPFGVASDSLQLIAFLAPLSPLTVTEFIRRGVLTTQVIRALDRSLRLARVSAGDAATVDDAEAADDDTSVEFPEVGWNNSLRSAYSALLSKPPDKIFRRTNWMRALRRLRLTDYSLNPGQVNDPAFHWWIFEQLEKAMKGEGAYSGARATDRRYAFWCLAELVADTAMWERVRDDAGRDREISPLIDKAEELRRHVAASGGEPNAFEFDPTEEYGGALLREHRRLRCLLDDASFEPRDPTTSVWRWASTSRRSALALLRNALFDPDVIKQRSSTDALGFSGVAVRESVTQTVAAVLEDLGGLGSEAPLYLIERSLAVLGMMGRSSAIPVVLKYVETRNDETLTQAVASAGDLAHLYPRASVGLMAWAADAVGRHLDEEDVVIAGITAMVACRKDPRTYLPGVQESTAAAVEHSLAWADAVAADPLRGSQPEANEWAYPASHQG